MAALDVHIANCQPVQNMCAVLVVSAWRQILCNKRSISLEKYQEQITIDNFFRHQKRCFHFGCWFRSCVCSLLDVGSPLSLLSDGELYVPSSLVSTSRVRNTILLYSLISIWLAFRSTNYRMNYVTIVEYG